MEYVSGIVTGFVTEVGKLLFCAVGQQIWGMYKFKSIVQKLQKQEEDIKDRKERVERRGDTIEPEVLTWLAKAEDFTTRLENISNEENKQCFKGCRNLKTRFIDSKEAVKLLNECDRLLALGYFPRTAQSSVPERTRSRYVKEDHKFDSRESVFEKVMQTLKSTDIKAIGVYGMGGVGKTTLVKKVYIQAKEDRLFDEVLMAEVTQKPDPIKIQGALADDLGLVLRDESVRGRADRLHAHLKKEKSVLVILDDVWEKLDLDVVGIPVKEYSQRDCKLVLTSRDQRVCTDMETEEQIEIRPLHLEEAVELFWGIVNDSIKRSQFEVLATQIVKNCSCLPIAVSAIAKALKNEGSSSWDDALNMVRGMNFRGAEDKVISVIELSYELLKNKDAQNLFLLCSLHKIGHSIGTDDLVKHAIGLNLFQYDNRVKDVRRKVDKLIKDLKDASLLLEDDKEDSVKVHDVIHVVAQKIASRSDQRMFNLHGVDDLEEKLDMGMYKDSKAISLPSVDIQELPQMPELPKLEFLLLSSQRKYSFWVENPLLEIPNSFFDRMKEMKVLVLTGVKLLSLNPSLGHLRNLQSLCLEHCDLEDIRTVGKLDKLEVFSFSHSNIEKLPEEIGDLARLKLLDLEHCRHLEVIPPNVLSKLTKLEELYMGDTSVKWDAQDNASLNELNQLKRLTILNIHIMDARIIPEDLFLGKLERCVIRICKGWGRFSKSGNSRILSLELNNENDLRGGVKKFFKKIEELYLDELVGFRNVYPQLGEEGFPNVKCLCAKNAPNISHIVMQEEHDSYNAFPMLESLSLCNLINLERICHGHLRVEFFSKLKGIEVSECDALTYLISSSTAKISFSNLQEIEVADCKVLENIFGNESDEDSVCIELPKLHTIKLTNLPKLTNFGPTKSTPTREIVPEEDDEDLITLFGRKVSFPSLKNLTIKRCNVNTLFHKKIVLTALDTLELSSVTGMEYVFTMSVASSLAHLRELTVEDCADMKEIVIEGAVNTPAIEETLFPKLNSLCLEDLPKLKRFCCFSGHVIKLASLSDLEIESCPNMQKFVSNPLSVPLTPNLKPEEMNPEENLFADAIPLFDEKILLPHLKSLRIDSMHHLGRLWHNVLYPTSFCSLEKLNVRFCEKLYNVFPHNMLDRLKRLEELTICDCNSLEEIFDVPEGSSSMEKNMIHIIFPKLTLLRLDGLKKLKSFYRRLHISKWPSLKRLYVERCDNVEILGSEFQILCEEKESVPQPQPLFIVDKDAFPRLETLELWENDNLKEIWHGGGIISKTLEFRGKTNIIKFPHYLLATDTLDIPSGYFKQIGGGSDNTFTAALRELRTLRVYGGDDDDDDDSLDKYFESTDSLACLVSSWVSFQNLTNLKIIGGCRGFRYLLTYSTAISLQHLTLLKISHCEMIEAIIMHPTDEVNDKIVFSQLKYLELYNLESLTSFYSGSHTFEFPSLEEMIVDTCPNMKVFSEGDSITPVLQSIQLDYCDDDDKWRLEGDVNNTIQKMFKEMVGFKSLYELRLSKFPRLKEIWHGQIPFSLFSRLCHLTVDKCADMSSAIPLNLLPCLKSLYGLTIEDCDSLEEVIHVERLDADATMSDIGNDVRDDDITISEIVFTELSTLTLKLLPKLMNFGPTAISTTLENIQEGDLEDLKSLFDNKVSFPSLKNLTLSSLNIPSIWCNKLPSSYSFGETLTSLDVEDCPHLKFLFSSSMVNGLQQLEKLKVANCESMEVIINKEGSTGENNFNNISSFDGKVCDSVEEIFDVPEGSSSMEGNTIRMIIFPKLTQLSLSGLRKLKSFYNGLHISKWPSLKELTVVCCDKVEIFGSKYQSFHEEKQSVPQPLFIVNEAAFPRLETLALQQNDNMKEIWHGGGIISKTLVFWGETNIIKFPHYLLATDTMDITSGYFKQIGGGSDNTFTAALRQLRTLTVDDVDDSLDEYFESSDSLACLVSSWMSFQNLTNLKITNVYSGFRYLLPYSTATSLQHLTRLEISYCKKAEVIIMPPTNEVNDKIVFSQLKYLELHNLESLTSFYSGSHTLEFPSLEEMIVNRCPNMKVFSEGDSITPELQSIQLEQYDDDNKWRLEGDVNSTIQKMFKEMVGFKGLYELRLSKFPRLKEIWHGQIPFSLFSRLCHLTVDKCADMSSAIPLNLLPCLKSLYGLTIEDCDSLEEVIHVERLDADATMSDIGNDVRDDDITISEIVFTELSTLTLKLLPKLMNFGPTAISTTLENIQEGDLEDLKSLFDNKVSFPSLKNLTLSSLNIPSIWCNKLPSSYSFGETLTSLDVEDCPHLKFLFSSSMVNGLQQLEKLKVANCESMEVIINKEGSTGENNFNNISSFDGKVCDSVEEIFDVPEGSSSMEGNTIRMIIFPKLTQLSLSGLRKLKSFYNGLHISKWPSLKELTVVCCDKVEIFGSKYQSFHEEKQSVPQPLFIVNEAAFPRLEDLVLEWNDNMKEIWHGGGIISKNLWFVGEINIIKFPHYLLATDTMDITSGYFKQIGGGSDNTFTAALRQLRTLTVDDVDDSLDEYFESSDSLACLTSSWMSFQNLTNLKIINVYSGFRYLLPYSTATSLQHLTRLEISYCKKAEVIIMPPTNEVNDKIVFSQLKYLELQNLESLTSFYSGNHTLEFPSLEEMIANRCPNMKVFSEGDSITPELQSIQLEQYDKWRLEGDVNSTIRKMFKEMVGFKGLEELRLSKFPHLKELWHGQIPFSLFGELGHLTVDKCADMSSAIPLKLLPCLESLRRLTIEDCDSLEEVIHMEGLDVDDQSLLLPELTRIRLIELPRLRNVWSKHPLEILGFTNLVHLSISKCNSLQYIFTTNIILGLKQLEKVKIRDCAMVETIITEDREKDAAMSDIVVPRLKFIILESLPRLTCFHSRSNVLECSSLKTMRINDRPQMKTFVSTSTEDLDLQDTPLFNEKVAFPNLEKLKLSKLPMVEHLWSKPCIQCLATIEISECLNLKSLVPYSASLQSLTTLKVSQCDGLTSLVTLSTAKSLEQLTRINVANCKIMREIITHIHTGDEENGRVVLAKLKCIELHCLPNISGFYLGDYTIELPALEQVVVRQCQKMNKFSKGALSTPKLKRVQRTKDEEEGCWKNNLNTIVQLLFEETNVQSQKED